MHLLFQPFHPPYQVMSVLPLAPQNREGREVSPIFWPPKAPTIKGNTPPFFFRYIVSKESSELKDSLQWIFSQEWKQMQEHLLIVRDGFANKYPRGRGGDGVCLSPHWAPLPGERSEQRRTIWTVCSSARRRLMLFLSAVGPGSGRPVLRKKAALSHRAGRGRARLSATDVFQETACQCHETKEPAVRYQSQARDECV